MPLLMVIELRAQLRDSIYLKIPWQECHRSYKNFFDIFSVRDSILNDSVFVKVGILYCPDCQRIFLKRVSGGWQEVTLDRIQSFPSRKANPLKLHYDINTKLLVIDGGKFKKNLNLHTGQYVSPPRVKPIETHLCDGPSQR